MVSSIKLEERQLDDLIQQYQLQNRPVRKRQALSVQTSSTTEVTHALKNQHKTSFSQVIRKKLPGYVYPSRAEMIRDRTTKHELADKK